jgi:hypothetical protein
MTATILPPTIKIATLPDSEAGYAYIFPTMEYYYQWCHGTNQNIASMWMYRGMFLVHAILYYAPTATYGNTIGKYAVRFYDQLQYHPTADISYIAWAIPQKYYCQV